MNGNCAAAQQQLKIHNHETAFTLSASTLLVWH